MVQDVVYFSRLTDFDSALFKSGKHFKLYEKLGSHPMEVDGEKGVYFAVWAPNADSVHVIGDFNYWNKQKHPLFVRWDGTGIWEGFIPGVKEGDVYKYFVKSVNGSEHEKGDPFAFAWELPPRTASIVRKPEYRWKDKDWMQNRHQRNSLNSPMSVYEVHIGSWRKPLEQGTFLSYKELADQLVAYVKEMGFTHVEFLPIMEHPYYGSWGYQITGYFAPSSRYGSPEEFKALVDAFHQAGIGVILDWVPSHFPSDGHGLFRFDGTALYEHEDPRKGYHPDWSSYIFNYDRHEVRSFLISNAIFWLDQYHVDGLRVDAVASMLYNDYSRKEDEWIPNHYGGRENLEAISFLRELNETVYAEFPDVQCIAEESTAWPGVSKPTFTGGLGFGMKWMMGWMHDTLNYFKVDPFFRKFHHHQMTFSLVYAFTENFMLPLSHDEVVHGKGSLLNRMPGDEWQKFANLRILFGYMFTHPGTKLLFMGGEFGMPMEWNHEAGLQWHLLGNPLHEGIRRFVRDLNQVYTSEPALFEISFEGTGFEWVDLNDHENSLFVYKRLGINPDEHILVVLNMTPIPRLDYRIGVEEDFDYMEILNSDLQAYGGSNIYNPGILKPVEIQYHHRAFSIPVQLPPLSCVILKGRRLKKADAKKTNTPKKEKKTPVKVKTEVPPVSPQDSTPVKKAAPKKASSTPKTTNKTSSSKK